MLLQMGDISRSKNYNLQRICTLQWLYNAYERVDVYPKAFPKLMDGAETSGEPSGRIQFLEEISW